MKDEEYDPLVALQAENDSLKSLLEEFKKQVAEQDEDNKSLKKHQDRMEELGNITTQQLATQRETVSRLKTDLDDEKASNANIADLLSAAYADHATTKTAQKSIVAARDRFEADLKDSTAQFASLLQQWQESQEQMALLQSQMQELHTLEAATTGLQSDIDRLQNSIADHERTLIVKDERIHHLEQQYQKERQRNLNAADAAAAAAAAAAASPVDAPPQPFPGLAESLADELEATSDDGTFEYEHLELSDVIEVVDFTPIAPASNPALTIDIAQTGSVAPIAPASSPALTIDITQAGSVAPIAPAAYPALTVDITQAGSVVPISADVPKLSLDVFEIGSVKPLEPGYTTSSASAQTDTQVLTTESAKTDAQVLTTELLHTATFEVAPIAPVDIDATHISTQTDSPTLSTTIIEAASIDIAPIDPVASPIPLTTNMVDSAIIVVSPVEQLTTRAPALTTNILQAGSIEIAPLEAELPVVDFTMAPITVTHEELPHETPAFTPATAPVMITSKPGKIGWFNSLLPYLTALLAFYCMVLFNELDDWRTANGVGYNYRNNSGGAYGNGRYFLGIPIAMDIGSSWWEEQLARYASVAITRFEDWAGISNVPLY